MTAEGKLTVTVHWDGRSVRGVDVASSRPLVVSRLLAGRPAAEAAAMVPRLYGVCAQAQGAAAAGALEAACAVDPSTGKRRQRERAVALETVQEHLRRLLIDGPEIVGLDPDPAPVAQAFRAIANGPEAGVVPALESLAQAHVFGEAPREWLARSDPESLEAWLAAAGTAPARLVRLLRVPEPKIGGEEVMLMPAAGRQAVLEAVAMPLAADPDFARHPHWHGQPAETGALAREASHPLVAALRARDGASLAVRVLARMVELARALEQLAAAHANAPSRAWVDAFAAGPAEGVAAVQTARGLLVHRARVEDGRVADYGIVAPTEWNFAPRGPLVRALTGTVTSDAQALARTARLVVHALDPCVACDVEVVHA